MTNWRKQSRAASNEEIERLPDVYYILQDEDGWIDVFLDEDAAREQMHSSQDAVEMVAYVKCGLGTASKGSDEYCFSSPERVYPVFGEEEGIGFETSYQRANKLAVEHGTEFNFCLYNRIDTLSTRRLTSAERDQYGDEVAFMFKLGDWREPEYRMNREALEMFNKDT